MQMMYLCITRLTVDTPKYRMLSGIQVWSGVVPCAEHVSRHPFLNLKDSSNLLQNQSYIAVTFKMQPKAISKI